MRRQELMVQWLEETLGHDRYELTVASADASFRQYFRITLSDHTSLIVMDAPPDKEDSKPFVQVQALMKAHGVPVPEIKALNLDLGFMLLSDLGNQPLLGHLDNDNVAALYRQAIQIIGQIQTAENLDDIPAYDEALLRFEMSLFTDWFLDRHLGVQLTSEESKQFEDIVDALVANALAQPQVLVHRDFHSRNLMWQASTIDSAGILSVIDFQDAVVGADTYDLVSLLKDCYIAWPDTVLDPLLQAFFQAHRSPSADYQAFVKQFDWMGAQRHLKAIGIFCRLNYRDGKSGYLNDIPLTMKHLLNTCQKYPALQPLAELINRHLPRLKP